MPTAMNTVDVCIIGSGVVGLTIAWQLLEENKNLLITIVDKEPGVGKHTSGRNSGVLHAGIYYSPDSLKAKVCVSGAKRLRNWCDNEKIPVLECGKVVTPQRPELDEQLEVLLERGNKNGATVEIIDRTQFNHLVPDGYTSTGRALWVHDTCVVNPLSVIQRLEKRLKENGVKFVFLKNDWIVDPSKRQISFLDGVKISYGHLFNCAGLQADRVARRFGIAKKYTLLPFRGNYWKFKKGSPFKFETNLYPVPDLEVPFLGVHVTPSIDGTIYLGPTATPALGRENYSGIKGGEFFGTLSFIKHMTTQFIEDKRVRRYIQDQAFEWLPHKFFSAAKQIIPNLSDQHIQRSDKVGIRPQLYDIENKELVQDFVLLDGKNSTHVVNAISPAFTSSFELADHILSNSKFN